MGELVEALVEREQPTHQEQDDRDHEGVHVAHPGVAELMRHIRGAAGALTTDQQKNLIATVCHGVDRLGQHRRGSGERERDKFGDRDPQIGDQRGQDCLRPALSTHGISVPNGCLTMPLGR